MMTYAEKLFEGWVSLGRSKGPPWRVGSRAVFWILGGAILFLSLLSLWQRHQMIGIGYEIEQLRQQRVELLRIQKELLVEVESLNTLERIEQIAIQQLKMKQALPQQRVYMKRNKTP